MNKIDNSQPIQIIKKFDYDFNNSEEAVNRACEEIDKLGSKNVVKIVFTGRYSGSSFTIKAILTKIKVRDLVNSYVPDNWIPSLFDQSLEQSKEKRIYRIHALDMRKNVYESLINKFKSKGLFFDHQNHSWSSERAVICYGPPPRKKFLFF